MNKTRTTRSLSQSPFVASSGSHTRFQTAKPLPSEHGHQWSVSHAGSGGGLRANMPSAASMVMVQEDGHCELSMDGGSYLVDYQGTPIMGATPARYVAGNAFFNYQLYGGLRKGGSVSFLTPSFRGYALAAFLSGYVYVVVMYLLLRIPVTDLKLDQSTSLKNVLSLQWTVGLLVGFVSDSYAPLRLRRKSYMVAGWTISAALWLVLFLIFQFAPSPPQTATVLLIVLAFLSLIVATTATDIRIIELSQQEEQQHRGRLLGSYEAIRIAAQLVAHALIAVIVSPDSKTFHIRLPFHVGFVFAHLAVVCAVPIYWLVHNAYEERSPAAAAEVAPLASTRRCAAPLPFSAAASSPPASQFRHVLRTFWQCAQQRVVWQLMLFNCALFFFGMFELGDVKRALQLWTRESSAVRLVRNCVGDAAFVATILLWRYFALNASWRTLTAAVVLSWCMVFLVLSSLVIYGVVHAPWICTLSWALRAPFRVLMLLAAFVPTIEIAPAGTEGTTYALLAAFQSIAKLLAAEIARAMAHAWPATQLSVKSPTDNSRSVENGQFYALLVMTLWVLCAVGGVFLLPKQKLDAQQLRAYGGYNTLPLAGLIIGFLTAFPYVFYLQISRV